jgi:hypothetical protein
MWSTALYVIVFMEDRRKYPTGLGQVKKQAVRHERDTILEEASSSERT